VEDEALHRRGQPSRLKRYFCHDRNFRQNVPDVKRLVHRQEIPGRYRVSMRLLLVPACALLLPGCLARTAVDVVTLPVKAVSAGVDAVTTSQAEADQRRGREIREEEERLGRLARRCERRPEREECAELGQAPPP
jgi:hypothetical protein